MFPVTSRYYEIETTTLMTPDGQEITYLRRRFLPDGAKAIALSEHWVAQGERLDNISARYFGDPEQFWLIGDANNAMWPDDLTAEVGRALLIPLPQGG